MVGEELHGGSAQGLVGAGIAQVNLEGHLCEQRERLLSWWNMAERITTVREQHAGTTQSSVVHTVL